MASGCTNGSSSASVLFQKLTPDTQVRYTGDAIPQLNICTGDLLSEIEAVILGKILDFSQGLGITITDIDLTQCECFTTKIGCCGREACQSLICILEAYLDCMCEMYADVQTLITKMEAIYDGPFVTSCLPGVTSSSKLPAIISAMITQICTNKANIEALTLIVNNLNTNLPGTIRSQVLAMIQSCNSQVVKSGSGATATITFKGFTPIGGIIPFGGNMGDFDANGVGRAGTDACGWAIADGRNGTVNMKGLFPVGTTDMVGTAPVSGGSLPINTVGGEYNHLLTASESGTGAHTHPVTDPGHSHIMSVNLDSASGANNSNYMKFDATSFNNTLDGAPDVGNIHAKIRNNTTGITIGSGGGSSAAASHNNMPPYRALYFIQRIS